MDSKGFDYLDSQILTHLDTNIAFHEHDYFRYPQHVTFESLGLFPGCKKIINYVEERMCEKLKNSLPSCMIINSSNIDPNIFFKEIRLYFSETHTRGFYMEYVCGMDDVYNQQRWNGSKFNFIDIYVNNFDTSKYSMDDFLELLTHELQHAWDDYMLYIHGTSIEKKKEKHDFNDLLNDIKINVQHEYDSTTDQQEKNKYKRYLDIDIPYLYDALYYLDKFEGSAYIAQVNHLIGNKEFNDSKEAIEFLRNNSVTYHNYKVLYELFTDDTYNKRLKEIGFKQSIINKYRNIAKQIWSKVVNHTYHILSDHIKYNSIREDIIYKLPKISDFNSKVYKR